MYYHPHYHCLFLQGEEGVDGGGLTREWLSLLTREIFRPSYALFLPAADGLTFQPNPNSGANPEHLEYFCFVGKVVGKAVLDGQLLDVHFTRPIYKHLLGLKVTLDDLQGSDPAMHKSLNMLLSYPLRDLGFGGGDAIVAAAAAAAAAATAVNQSHSAGSSLPPPPPPPSDEYDDDGQDCLYFSADVQSFGETVVVDLVENGRHVPVTDNNKAEYVQLVAQHRTTSAFATQLEALLRGFHAVVPRDCVAIFDPLELELLISGLPEIDLDDLKRYTEYHGYKSSDPAIERLWRVLDKFSKEEKALFVQFTTGR